MITFDLQIDVPDNFTGKCFVHQRSETQIKENGLFHSETEPAIVCKVGGYFVQEWWIKGERHRLDGPAKQTNFGEEFWVEGKRISREAFWIHPKVVQFNISKKLKEIVEYGNS